MITDNRGKTPNYVIVNNELIHQPSGRKIPLPKNYSDEDVADALEELRA